MKVSVIFTETLGELGRGTRRIVHQGGQNSGKTVNILASIATHLTKNPGTVATVTSMSFPHLKAGALRDFDLFVYKWFNFHIKSYHKSDHVYTWKNGSILEFKTYKNETDARGAKRDILFINEANTFDYMTFFQLDSRSKITILDYNPTIRFWCHDKVIGQPGTILLISDHRHNPFLSEDKHNEIENLCTFQYEADGVTKSRDSKGEPIILSGDYELWKVYARGLTGNVTGLVFTNWVQIEEMPIDQEWIYSVDFGYTNDPTTIVRQCRIGENLYVEELVYQKGEIPPREIKRILGTIGYTGTEPLYCEHDPDMIKQLKLLKVKAIAARKGAGSINAGIEKLKEYKVFYKGKNIKRELSLYIWLMDDLGNSTNTAIDANNHTLDAIRYGTYTHFYRAKNPN